MNLHFNELYEWEIAHKNELIQEIASEQKKELENSVKIGRHIKNPFEKLKFCTDFNIKDDLFCQRFLSQYR